jgi:adenylate cyclase class 2
MFEVEQKYRVDDLAELQQRLAQMDAVRNAPEHHSDTYYNHPSRDFAETGEAFRVRRIDGLPLITYKGAKLSGPMKARREMEWRLDPGDPDGNQTEELLQVLGFRRVANVQKQRSPHSLGGDFSELGVVIDEVESVGIFAELERIVAEESQIEPAQIEIQELSDKLGLRMVEPRSYLEIVLESDSGNR